MYIEYYVVVEIRDHELTATISQIKYHHFNPRNYSLQPIYSFQSNPFDSTDKFETLATAPGSNKDISNLSNFLNSDINRLLEDLKLSLKGNNALASNAL